MNPRLVHVGFVVDKLALGKVFYKYFDFPERRDSSVVWRLGYGLDDRGIGVRFPARVRDFLWSVTSIPAPGPTQPPIHVSPGVKQQLREAYPSPPFNDEFKII
jgi:hypothetical protein